MGARLAVQRSAMQTPPARQKGAAARRSPAGRSAPVPASGPKPAALAGPQAGFDFARTPIQPAAAQVGVQRGAPAQALEAEAHRIVRGLGMPGPARVAGNTGALRAETGQGAALLPVAQQQAVAALEGRGSPLPGPQRQRLEPHLGRDLGAVRVHEDASLARALHFDAFAFGRNVVVDPVRCPPSHALRDPLMAHEATHVLQQQGQAKVVQGGELDEIEDNVGWAYGKAAALVGRGKAWAVEKLMKGLSAAKERGRQELDRYLAEQGYAPGTRLRLMMLADDILTANEFVITACVGIVAGGAEGLIDAAKGIVKLGFGILNLTFKVLKQWLVNRLPRKLGYGRNHEAEVYLEEVADNLAKVPAGLRALYAQWRQEFDAADSAKRGLMFGELSGQIAAFLATFAIGGGAGTAGKASKAGQVAEFAPALATATATAGGRGGRFAGVTGGAIATTAPWAVIPPGAGPLGAQMARWDPEKLPQRPTEGEARKLDSGAKRPAPVEEKPVPAAEAQQAPAAGKGKTAKKVAEEYPPLKHELSGILMLQDTRKIVMDLTKTPLDRRLAKFEHYKPQILAKDPGFKINVMKLSPEATAAKDPASQVIGAFAGGDGMRDTYFLIFLRNGEVLQGHTRFARQFRLDPSGGFIPVLRELKSW